MHFSNLLQDPMVVLELMAIVSTFLFIAKLSFLDTSSFSDSSLEDSSDDSIEIGNSITPERAKQALRQLNSVRPANSSSIYLMSLFPVGSLISLPKSCLAQQTFNLQRL